MKEIFTDTYNPQHGCTPITEGLDRFEIYTLLTERIPYLQRHDTTARVMSESGVDMLLDQLIIIQEDENPGIEIEVCMREFDGITQQLQQFQGRL